MKLKPEHLQHFPFYEDHQSPGLLVQLDDDVLFPVSKSNLDYVIEKQLKPLLRPLSELKHKFMNEAKLPAILQQELAFVLKAKDCSLLQPKTKELLVKNLFDIDGLIEAGLAVPYNFEWKKDLESFWILD